MTKFSRLKATRLDNTHLEIHELADRNDVDSTSYGFIIGDICEREDSLDLHDLREILPLYRDLLDDDDVIYQFLDLLIATMNDSSTLNRAVNFGRPHLVRSNDITLEVRTFTQVFDDFMMVQAIGTISIPKGHHIVEDFEEASASHGQFD